MVQEKRKKLAVAVDAYSSGNYFPGEFAKLGVELVHVQSSPELMASMLAPQMTNFVANIAHLNLDTTISELERYSPIAVFAGQEPGVPLADALSEKMGLPSNGSSLSNARRNKFDMIERLHHRGVRAAKQMETASVAEAMAWLEESQISQCVVKPLQSASTDGVTICHDTSDVSAAIERVLSTEDIFGDANKKALVQEFLPGKEYIVDTVSLDGNHFICGVWMYQKRLLSNGANVYERDILLSPGDPAVPALGKYTREALDALGIAFGPAHSEVIITPEGPTLVETGARVNGNMHPDFHNVCFGHNQAGLTALMYAEPRLFSDSYRDKMYQRKQPARVFHAVSETSGIILSINEDIVDALEALPSVHTVQVKPKVGAELKITRDLLTSPLRIFLTHEDETVIDADCIELERLQHQIFQV